MWYIGYFIPHASAGRMGTRLQGALSGGISTLAGATLDSIDIQHGFCPFTRLKELTTTCCMSILLTYTKYGDIVLVISFLGNPHFPNVVVTK